MKISRLMLLVILCLAPRLPNHTRAIEWSTFLGGSDNDLGYGIAVDDSGNVYVTGVTASTDFPVTTGSYSIVYNGNADIFIAKLNPSGSSLVYSTFLGGNGDEYYYNGNIIAIDESRNVYITGCTRSTNFPTTPGAFDRITNGFFFDAFVTKLNSSGSGLIYSTFLGGTGDDYGYSIAVDSDGNAYITGETETVDFPVTPGAYDAIYNTDGDAFLTKLNPVGSDLVYSTFLGGSDFDEGRGVAIDDEGHAYVTGPTESSDFPVTLGAFDTTFNGDEDAFVTKINATGSDLVYSTYIGGSNYDGGMDIAVDEYYYVYLTGYTLSDNFPTTLEAFDTDFNGGNLDAYVLKLNLSGSSLVYSTFIGGGEHDDSFSITIDSGENVYIVGNTNSIDFPVTPGAYDTTHNGSHDTYIAKLNASGSALLYSSYLGSPLSDTSYSIAIDDSGNAYVTGNTYSSSFPTTPGAFDTTFNGIDDAFVTKLSLSPSRTAATSPWSLYY